MNKLVHIVYVSYTVNQLSESELDDFLKIIRTKNLEMDVTGLLLYNNEAFIQVIEGEEQTIKNLFEIIKKDSRHTNVVLLLEENINERDFPDWSMGYYKINKNQTNTIPGFVEYMQNKDTEITITGSCEQLLHLLNSFKKFT